MLKANDKQLKTINERWNDLEKSYTIGLDYMGEGTEVSAFTIDDNDRITMNIIEWHLNSQYALRARYCQRHPRLKQAEIDYLLGNINELNRKGVKIMAKKNFTVEVTETLQRQVEIEAENEQEALQKAKDLYRDEEIVLGWQDFVGNDFQIIKKEDK